MKARPADEVYLDLVHRYQAPILRYIHRLVGDPDTAEELTQDTYMKAYSALDRLELTADAEDRRRAWLYRIAHNTATDHLRRRARLRWLPLGRAAAVGASDPEATALAGQPVQSALRALRPEQREVIHLFLEAELTAPEVAEVLGLTAAAARKRLQRARAAFEAAYVSEAPPEPPDPRRDTGGPST